MCVFPADGERFINLNVLTRFNAAAAKDALGGIVAIEGIGVIFRVGLGLEWKRLVLDGEKAGGVMDRAVAVVVVADGAIEEMVFEEAVECFALRGGGA